MFCFEVTQSSRKSGQEMQRKDVAVLRQVFPLFNVQTLEYFMLYTANSFLPNQIMRWLP